jgi:antitoxin component YwqK of YwqJK toxin-antitoxin module
MSSDTSSPDSTRSASEIRQDIADYVLKQTDELSDVPGVKEFVDDHGRLTKEIAEAKERQERLANAKEEYEPLEQRVGPCRRSLKDAETKLAKLYAPLGEAAFKALLADDIDEQPLFADRLAAHKRVQVLQAECDALLPGADAGVVQKTKAKAKQLAIKGKIKLEELKFGGIQAEIGRKIVEDELDDSIQCDPTNQLLSQIKDQRDGMARLSAELKEAESELTESGKRLSETVGLASIGRSTELDTAIKLGAKTIKQHDSDVATATRGLADALREVDASTLPKTLVPLLEGLGNAPADDFAGRVKESRRKGVEAAASAKKYWSGLSRRTQLIVGGVAVAVILLGVFFFPGGGGESDQIVGSTNGGDSSDNKEHNVQDKQSAQLADVEPSDNEEKIRREKELAQFADVDYSYDFSDVDYESIPPGATKQTRFEEVTKETEGVHENDIGRWEEASGYRTSTGEFVRHGKQTIWFHKTKLRKSLELDWLNGTEHGKSTSWYANGTKLRDGTFVAGKDHGLMTFQYKDGALWQEWPKVNGAVHGIMKEWYDNGQLKLETVWVNDEKHGRETHWYPNGQKLKEGVYVIGKKHGRVTRWHDNGQKAAEDVFVDGIGHGHHRLWYADGAPRSDYHMADGLFHGSNVDWFVSGVVQLRCQYDRGRIKPALSKDGNYKYEDSVIVFKEKLTELSASQRGPFYLCLGIIPNGYLIQAFGRPESRVTLGVVNSSTRRLWKYRCSDGLVAVTLEGSKFGPFLFVDFTYTGLSNSITEVMTKTEFLRKLGGRRSSFDLDDLYGTFGYPFMEQIEHQPRRQHVFTYKCVDGSVSLRARPTKIIQESGGLRPVSFQVRNIDTRL